MNFNHRQAAHCENGVIQGLLSFYGLELSESLIFGLSSGLFFIYIPFLKIHEAPVVSFRSYPYSVFKRLNKLLNIQFCSEKFKNPNQASVRLDNLLAEGKIIGLQVGVFNLPYFPEPYRFHFNGHNIIVYEKIDSIYKISDPVMSEPCELNTSELSTVRFSNGLLSPKGHLFYPIKVPKTIQLKPAIKQAIIHNCKSMLNPLPFIGVNGIKFLSKKIIYWSKNLTPKKCNYFLAQIVRMQEEIGTGGGGFRYIYASFLQEAAEIMEWRFLNTYAEEMAKIAEKWRSFAVLTAKIIKNRNESSNYNHIEKLCFDIFLNEKIFFNNLLKSVKNCPLT